MSRVIVVLSLLVTSWIVFKPIEAAQLPSLRDGDLVFQTSGGRQSVAILASTGSPFTHMGIVRIRDDKPVVVEAVGPVRETPLSDFIGRGAGRRIAIYRHRTLTPAHAALILSAAETFYGRGYDRFFAFDNDEIYCSELPLLAFAAAGLSIGRVQRVSDLRISAPQARGLIEERWRAHPACAGSQTLEDCLPAILDQTLITPASIAADGNFIRIHTDW